MARTKKVIDKLQNYYRMAIHSNVGDLREADFSLL